MNMLNLELERDAFIMFYVFVCVGIPELPRNSLKIAFAVYHSVP